VSPSTAAVVTLPSPLWPPPYPDPEPQSSTHTQKRIISEYEATRFPKHFNGLTAVRFRPVLRSALSSVANTFTLEIPCDLCLLPAQFCDVTTEARNFESRMQIAGRYAQWKAARRVSTQMWRCCGDRQKSSQIHGDLTKRLLSVSQCSIR
jgi:hypothetical protein